MNRSQSRPSIRDLGLELLEKDAPSRADGLPAQPHMQANPIQSISEITSVPPNLQEIAKKLLTKRTYINSRASYRISEEYLNRIRAISKVADIPITNVINNMCALFFDTDGDLNPINAVVKSLLIEENTLLKEYLSASRPSTKNK